MTFCVDKRNTEVQLRGSSASAVVPRENCSKGAARMMWHTKTAHKEMELLLPAVNEIWYRVMLAE